MKLDGILIDLHCHLDGSLSVDTVKYLAKRNRISIPKNDDEIKVLLSVSDNCADLNEYLEKFALPLSLLQTKESLTYATHKLCDEFKKQGLMYAEIRFAPQLHTKNGLSQEDAVKAVIEGKKLSSLKSNIILCCMRGDNNRDENLETIALAKTFYKKGVCAIDLAGAEALYKTNTFGYIFDSATRCRMPITVHCGEADGKNSILYAMENMRHTNTAPKRFGHGIRILEDETLSKEAIDNNFFFELCPTSNLNTKIFASYYEYPVKEMLKKGMKVTINTDNCSVSDTTIVDEFNNIITGNKLDLEDVIRLLRNSVDASFADKRFKKSMHNKINAFMGC